MTQTEIQTAEAPRPAGPYSQAIRLPGQLIFVAGQGAADPATGRWASDEIAGQTRQVFDNIEAILRAAGSTMADVVKVSVFLARFEDFHGSHKLRRQQGCRPDVGCGPAVDFARAL